MFKRYTYELCINLRILSWFIVAGTGTLKRRLEEGRSCVLSVDIRSIAVVNSLRTHDLL